MPANSPNVLVTIQWVRGDQVASVEFDAASNTVDPSGALTSEDLLLAAEVIGMVDARHGEIVAEALAADEGSDAAQ